MYIATINKLCFKEVREAVYAAVSLLPAGSFFSPQQESKFINQLSLTTRTYYGDFSICTKYENSYGAHMASCAEYVGSKKFLVHLHVETT